MDLSTTHVVTCISNPARYKSRYDLFYQFEKEMLNQGVHLWVAELAFGERPFEVTSPDFARHLQLRTNAEIWHKENLLNLIVQRLPPNWKKVLWIDADITFVRQDWLEEAWHQLEHHAVIQLFSEAIDLGPNRNVVQSHKGFCWSYLTGQKYGPGYTHWHPGFAWGMTRQAWDAVGGLLDTCILGAADHHMALALIGQASGSVPEGVSSGYKRDVIIWEKRAEVLKKNIGYVPGMIYHSWHGKKSDRRYISRWDYLKNGFDPDYHLQRDWQGVYQLSAAAPIKLRDDIRKYFRQRNEDSIDEE